MSKKTTFYAQAPGEYTSYMKLTAQATDAPKVKNARDNYIATVYAGVLVVMLVAQLFTFEDTAPLIESFGLGGGEPFAKVLAGCIVIAELLALPFLLRMRLSPLMRMVSMVSGWVAALWWVYIALFSLAAGTSIANVGFFGVVVNIPSGILAVVLATIVASATIWATNVLWRGARTVDIPLLKK